MILELIDEAVAAGAREHAACALFGLSARALQRWRAADIGDDRRYGPKTNPTMGRQASILEPCSSLSRSRVHHSLRVA